MTKRNEIITKTAIENNDKTDLNTINEDKNIVGIDNPVEVYREPYKEQSAAKTDGQECKITEKANGNVKLSLKCKFGKFVRRIFCIKLKRKETKKEGALREIEETITSLKRQVSDVDRRILEILEMVDKKEHELIKQQRIQSIQNTKQKLYEGKQKKLEEVLKDFKDRLDVLNNSLNEINDNMSVIAKTVNENKERTEAQATEQLNLKKETEDNKKRMAALEEHVKNLEFENRTCHLFMFEILNCQNDEERQKSILKELEVYRYSSYSMGMVEKIYDALARSDNYEQVRLHINDLNDVIKAYRKKTTRSTV